MSKFTHQVILITGASSGIGKAVARALASHAHKLVLVATDRSCLQQWPSPVKDWVRPHW